MLGQSYGVFKLTEGIFRLAARGILGVSPEAASKIGTSVGTYVGGWAAIITADPAGGAAIAVDVANKVDKGLNGPG